MAQNICRWWLYMIYVITDRSVIIFWEFNYRSIMYYTFRHMSLMMSEYLSGTNSILLCYNFEWSIIYTNISIFYSKLFYTSRFCILRHKDIKNHDLYQMHISCLSWRACICFNRNVFSFYCFLFYTFQTYINLF